MWGRGWRRKEPQRERCPQLPPRPPPDISPACTQHAGTRLGSFSIFYFLKVDNLRLSYHTNSSSLCISLKVLGCDSAHRSGTHGYRTKAEREGGLARAPTVPSLSAAAGVFTRGPRPRSFPSGRRHRPWSRKGQNLGSRQGLPQATTLAEPS